MMKRHAWLVVGLLVSSSALAQGKPAMTKDEDGIKAALADFSASWSKHDPKALASAFADDGTLINPWGRVAKGKAEVEKLFADEQVGATAPLKDTTWTPTVSSWRPLGATNAFVDIEAEMVGMKAPDGKPVPGKHHLAVVMTKKANKWWIEDARPYFWAPPAPAAKPAVPAKK